MNINIYFPPERLIDDSKGVTYNVCYYFICFTFSDFSIWLMEQSLTVITGSLLFRSLTITSGVFRTTTLPALFVFGKDSIDVSACAKTLSQYILSNGKPVLVCILDLKSLFLFCFG